MTKQHNLDVEEYLDNLDQRLSKKKEKKETIPKPNRTYSSSTKPKPDKEKKGKEYVDGTDVQRDVTYGNLPDLDQKNLSSAFRNPKNTWIMFHILDLLRTKLLDHDESLSDYKDITNQKKAEKHKIQRKRKLIEAKGLNVSKLKSLLDDAKWDFTTTGEYLYPALYYLQTSGLINSYTLLPSRKVTQERTNTEIDIKNLEKKKKSSDSDLKRLKKLKEKASKKLIETMFFYINENGEEELDNIDKDGDQLSSFLIGRLRDSMMNQAKPKSKDDTD